MKYFSLTIFFCWRSSFRWVFQFSTNINLKNLTFSPTMTSSTFCFPFRLFIPFLSFRYFWFTNENGYASSAFREKLNLEHQFLHTNNFFYFLIVFEFNYRELHPTLVFSFFLHILFMQNNVINRLSDQNICWFESIISYGYHSGISIYMHKIG